MVSLINNFKRLRFLQYVYNNLNRLITDVMINRIYRSARLHRYKKILSYFRSIAWHCGDHPKAVAIDIVSVCNLKCPLCSVPPYITKKDNNFIPVDRYKEIVRRIEHFVSDLSLVYAGEPFLHPELDQLIELVSNEYYVTTITNATLLNDKNIKYVIDNIDKLQISFDGFTKESFEKYRIGADYDKVKGNILDLIDKRTKSVSGLPSITITYLIHAYNNREVNDCRKFWKKKGVDNFMAKDINLNVHRRLDGKGLNDLAHWLPNHKSTTLYDVKKDCVSIRRKAKPCTSYLTPIVRMDGELLLCCHDIFNTVKVGNILDKCFVDLWNDAEYINIRKLAKQRKLKICQQCGR